MTVDYATHRVTHTPAVIAQCDTCPTAIYLDKATTMPADVVTYLHTLGWTITGPAHATTRAECPDHHQEP